MVQVWLACWDSHLICEDNNLVSIFLELLHFFRNAFVPKNPVTCIFSEFGHWFYSNYGIVYVKWRNFFRMFYVLRMAHLTRFFHMPIPACFVFLLLLLDSFNDRLAFIGSLSFWCWLLNSFSHFWLRKVMNWYFNVILSIFYLICTRFWRNFIRTAN